MKYVTYLHIDSDGIIFYVGRGKLGRELISSKYSRSKHWFEYVKNKRYKAIIVGEYNTEEDSYKHEIKLIAHYGRADLGLGALINGTNGGRGTPGQIFLKKLRYKCLKPN
jgi:hypothetical protein